MSSLSKGQKRLLIVLAIVLAYAAFDVINHSDQYLSYYRGGNENKKVNKLNVTDVNAAHIKKASSKNEKYLTTWGQDPFFDQSLVRRRVAPGRVQSEVQLSLKAISYNGLNSVVMINDRVLMIGDLILGYRVDKIEPTRVILSKGTENKILILR